MITALCLRVLGLFELFGIFLLISMDALAKMGNWISDHTGFSRYKGDYKLLFYYETRQWELYNLAEDIGENSIWLDRIRK